MHTTSVGPAIGYGTRQNLSGTRVRAAGWAVPAGEYLGRVKDTDVRDVKAAAQHLKGDERAWDVFARLSLGWDQSALELARCAAVL